MNNQEDPFAEFRPEGWQAPEGDQEDPFAAFRPGAEEEVPEGEFDISDPFWMFRPEGKKKKKDWTEEDIERETDRNVAQFLSRFAEGAAGTPGNVESLARMFPRLKRDEGKRKTVLPTTAELRNFSKEKSMGYLEPKNKAERHLGEFFGSVGGRKVPGMQLGRFKELGKYAIPAIGQGGKAALEHAGLEEGEAGIGGAGLELMLDLANGANGPKLASNMLNKVRTIAGKKKTFINDFLTLNNDLRSKWGQTVAGLKDPAKKKALDQMKNLERLGKNGELTFDQILDIRKETNKIRDELGAWNVPKSERPKEAKQFLDEWDQGINKLVDKHLSQASPEALDLYRRGNRAWGAIEQSKVISDFAKKSLTHPIASKALMTMFGGSIPLLAGTGKIGTAAKAATLAPPLYSVHKIGQVAYRMSKSPDLMKHYTAAIAAATKNNAKEFNKQMAELDKKFQEQGMDRFLEESEEDQ